jgi:hypothetical protein
MWPNYTTRQRVPFFVAFYDLLNLWWRYFNPSPHDKFDQMSLTYFIFTIILSQKQNSNQNIDTYIHLHYSEVRTVKHYTWMHNPQ